MPFVAYQVPSIRQKIHYTIWDFQMHQQGQTQHISDGDRWVTIDVGKQLMDQNRWLGVGIGDLHAVVKSTYALKYPTHTNIMLPHNQYILTWAATGFFGFFGLLYGLFWPLWHYRRLRDPFLWSLTGLLASSFLFEATLGSSTGVNLHAFVLCFWMLRQKSS